MSRSTTRFQGEVLEGEVPGKLFLMADGREVVLVRARNQEEVPARCSLLQGLVAGSLRELDCVVTEKRQEGKFLITDAREVMGVEPPMGEDDPEFIDRMLR